MTLLFSKQNDWISLKTNSRPVIDGKVYPVDSLEWDSFLVSFLLHAILFLLFWLFVPVIQTSEHNGNSDRIRIPIKTVIISETPVEGVLDPLAPQVPPPPQPVITPPQPPVSPSQPQKKSLDSGKTLSDSKPTPAPAPPASGPKEGVAGPAQTYPGDRDTPVFGYPVTPIYPKSALNFGWGGTVEVDLVVDKDGKVKDYTIVKSTGHAELDMAFVRYMQRQTLLPKRIRGENVESTLRMSHEFALD